MRGKATKGKGVGRRQQLDFGGRGQGNVVWHVNYWKKGRNPGRTRIMEEIVEESGATTVWVQEMSRRERNCEARNT